MENKYNTLNSKFTDLNSDHDDIENRYNTLNEEYVNLQNLQRDKYESQKLAQKYENDTNTQINKLGRDLERSQTRLKVSVDRFTKKIKQHQSNTQKIKNYAQNFRIN